ncbi:MAG TPA: hypothetical protein DIS79_00385 [Bacteroidetes bacterium]|nr:hypothetical protein [Bacteroidota bacterium]HRK05779.1 S8 family serine peptidase [Chlorobiota bacterium]
MTNSIARKLLPLFHTTLVVLGCLWQPIQAQELVNIVVDERQHAVAKGFVIVRLRAGGLDHDIDSRLPEGFRRFHRFVQPRPDMFGAQKPVSTPAERLARTFILQYSTSDLPDVIARRLVQKHGDVVEYAEPWYAAQTQAVPNDPLYSQQEALATIRASEAWDIEPGDTSVVIAISDDGIDGLHEDLRPNIAANVLELPGNNIDDDNNGVVDDYVGANFTWREDGSQPGSTFSNRNDGHGTKVSGIAAARQNNGIGVSGVGGRCKFFPMKCASRTSGGVLYGYISLIYAAERGFPVVNTSWGAVRPPSLVDRDIINYCLDLGTVVVASAGNHGNDAPNASWLERNYPAAYPGVVGVGETTPSDVVTPNSALGINADILAPGNFAVTTLLNGGYGANGVSGTSFASPIVAGAVALVRSRFPNLSAREVAAYIARCGKDVSSKNPNAPVPLPLRLDLVEAVQRDPRTVPVVIVENVDYLTSTGAPLRRLRQGDTIGVQIRLRNVLANVEDLSTQLSTVSGAPWIVRLEQAEADLGNIASNESVTLPTVRVILDRVDPVDSWLRLTMVANGYEDAAWIPLPRPSTVTLFENDSILYGMSDVGLVGLDDRDILADGYGFARKPFSPVMPSTGSGGGLIVVEGNSRSATAYDNLQYRSDFFSVKPYDSPNVNTAILRDGAVDGRRIGVEVRQRNTFPTTTTPATVWSISVKNITDAPLQDVAAGYLLDIDIGPIGANNRVRSAPEAIPTTFAAQATTAMVFSRTYFSTSVCVASLAPSDRPRAQMAGMLLRDIVDDGDGFTDADRVVLFTNDGATMSTDSGDACGTIGMLFPGQLAPGDSVSFMIVIGVGRSESEATSIVRSTLENPMSVVDNGSESSDGLMIRPLPTESEVLVQHPTDIGSLRIVNVQGQTVLTVVTTGGQTTIDVTALAPGWYNVLAIPVSTSTATSWPRTIPLLIVR